jgi:hypothetical protein
MNNQCVERVCPREEWGYYHQYQCSRKGVVARDGRWYCAQHDPVRVQERRAASTAKYQAERAERNAARELQRRKNAAWDAMGVFNSGSRFIGVDNDGQGQWVACCDWGAAVSDTPWDAVLDLVEKVKDENQNNTD